MIYRKLLQISNHNVILVLMKTDLYMHNFYMYGFWVGRVEVTYIRILFLLNLQII